MKRTYYLDKYNNKKIWEVTELSHGIYLRQYISGRKFGRGVRTNNANLKDMGIIEMEVIKKWRNEFGDIWRCVAELMDILPFGINGTCQWKQKLMV